MNTKEIVPLLCLCAAYSAKAVDYDFSGDLFSHFADVGDPGHTFEQIAGRLVYHNGGTVGSERRKFYAWNDAIPRADQSWSLRADVTVPRLAELTPLSTGWAVIGLACLVGDNYFAVGLEIGDTRPSGRYVVGGSRFGGSEVQDELETTEEKVCITITYDAASRTLRALSGATSFYQIDIDSPSADWGMSPSDTFTLSVAAASENRAVGAVRPLQLDNLNLTVVDPARTTPILGITQSMELQITTANGAILTELQKSSDMNSWYTIQTLGGGNAHYRILLPADGQRSFYRAAQVP